MTIKVIGASFGRTGTMSLKQALERLGCDKCYHMAEVFQNPTHIAMWASLDRGETVDLAALFDGYQASVDWPSSKFWRQQLEAYPEATVLLSTRDPERWYESVMNTIYPGSMDARDSAEPNQKRFGQWVWELIWKGVFDDRMEDREHCIDVFLKHEAAVKAEVPSERLLVFEAAEGWPPLCEMLGVAVPDEPYPRVNTTQEFLARRESPPE